ncbi:Elongation factor 2 (EF-2) (Colonial temperature-sensitive 3) [Durusdinium trenchii]|uniref:Elongation factor 2 (EF-2) (Colonial temperature-sensitive 3) n=1 Tax=Durusdinium trenchii TaxID=1381693 RepID=A0ABP0HLZ7_9DINO
MLSGGVRFAAQREQQVPLQQEEAKDQRMVRNVAIIAHVDHGKTTITDSLLTFGGKLKAASAGDALVLDSSTEERTRGITISATAINVPCPNVPGRLRAYDVYVGGLPWDTTMAQLIALVSQRAQVQVEHASLHAKRGYAYATVTGFPEVLEQLTAPAAAEEDEGGRKPVMVVEHRRGDVALEPRSLGRLGLNVIDCPGHADFVAEVHTSLRISDGALLVVDATEGVKVQTEAVLQSALKQRVRPILVLNKMDRFFNELRLEADDVVDRLETVIHKVNSIIAAVDPEWQVSILENTVLLGSGYLGWACSLDDLLALLSKSTGKPVQRIKTAKGATTVVAHCLKALSKVHRVGQSGNFGKLCELFAQLGADEKAMAKYLKANDPAKRDWKQVMRFFFRGLLPLAPALVRAVVQSVPSSFAAQSLRSKALVVADPAAQEILPVMERGDPEGPTLVHVVKATLLPGSGRASNGGAQISSVVLGFVARVLSGQVRAGQAVTLVARDGAETSLVEVPTKVTRVVRMFGPRLMEPVSVAHAGEICVLQGLLEGDAAGKVGATSFLLMDSAGDGKGAFPLTADPMHTIVHVAAVVHAALSSQEKSARAQKRILDAAKVLSRLDPCLGYHVSPETREIVLSGAGELHLEVCLAQLRELTGLDKALELRDPEVSFKETCLGPSQGVHMGKSANKLNRVVIRAQPVGQELLDEIEEGNVVPRLEDKALATELSHRFGWDASHARRVWALGPLPRTAEVREPATCFLVNATTGVQNILDIKAGLVEAFHQVCAEGPCAGQPLRGVVFFVEDAKIHSDPAHRRPQQIVPMASRALRSAFMSGVAVVAEPVMAAQVKAPAESLAKVLDAFREAQAQIGSVFTIDGVAQVEATICVRHSFGLAGKLTAFGAGLSLVPDGFKCHQPNEDKALVAQLRTSANLPIDPDDIALIDAASSE